MINEIQEEIQEHKEKDIRFDWVKSSRFLFYVQLFCLLALVLGMCYKLYDMRYKGKPDVEVPDNTLYTPKYK
jgi:G:T-mismatch repair DNA endonuclease (very short patch repair protein)